MNKNSYLTDKRLFKSDRFIFFWIILYCLHLEVAFHLAFRLIQVTG